MNKRKVEEYMTKAIKIMEEEFKDKKIPKEFKGYISQFGTSIIQSGLMPAVAFFENDSSNTMANRPFVVKAVFKIIEDKNIDDMTLLEYIYRREDKDRLKEEIINAVIALKLVLKSFKSDESTNSGGN